MVLGSGIRKKPIPDPGSRGQKAPDPGSGSATLAVLRYLLVPCTGSNRHGINNQLLRTTAAFQQKKAFKTKICLENRHS